MLIRSSYMSYLSVLREMPVFFNAGPALHKQRPESETPSFNDFLFSPNNRGTLLQMQLCNSLESHPRILGNGYI